MLKDSAGVEVKLLKSSKVSFKAFTEDRNGKKMQPCISHKLNVIMYIKNSYIVKLAISFCMFR